MRPFRRQTLRSNPLRFQNRTIAATGGSADTAQINTNETNITLIDGRVTTIEDSATGIVDGGRADVQHLEATDINGGSASI